MTDGERTAFQRREGVRTCPTANPGAGGARGTGRGARGKGPRIVVGSIADGYDRPTDDVPGPGWR